MTLLHVLFEHAAGYAIFRVREFEEVGMFLPQVQTAIKDISKFNGVVKLVGFLPFKTALSALENGNAVSEGIVTDDLINFLDTSLLQDSAKENIQLGVSDTKIAASINEALGITCIHKGVVVPIMRGIRLHFHNLVKGFSAKSSEKANLGLAHAYSRTRVKFNVNKIDNMIIQAIALVDQLDKDINLFSMRVREWYSHHFPELMKIVPENNLYARLVKLIKNRKDLSEESLPALEEIVMDSGKAQAILAASRSSMGMDISPVDLINIEQFALRVIDLIEYKKKMSEYLHNKMSSIAPNLAELIGEQVGARLISHAGSLTNLAKNPASTVQILGAEKALFRALKTKGNTPKYGLLFHSTFIGRAGAKNKGRMSRYLANKCSIAARIDNFSDHPSRIFGVKLREQVEDRLKFYETGDVPKKNVDVMKEAIEEIAQEQSEQLKENKKKKKKNKKRNSEVAMNESSVMDSTTIDEENSEESKQDKKKKKKKHSVSQLDESVLNSSNVDAENCEDSKQDKKKKKKRKHSEIEDMNDSVMDSSTVNEANGDIVQKKKKKKKSMNTSQ